MHCVVTAGPTYEKLDEVRRLTNLSTGRLGMELAAHLTGLGHEVTLLLGESATWGGLTGARRIERFSTTADLSERLQELGDASIGAVFHVAAVSDFRFGRIYEKRNGELTELHEGKVSTREGTLLAELVPTQKIIRHLRAWFPKAVLVGWKYEVDGSRADAMRKALAQIRDNQTTASVANGPAYGSGFGLATGNSGERHLNDRETLFSALAGLISDHPLTNDQAAK